MEDFKKLIVPCQVKYWGRTTELYGDLRITISFEKGRLSLTGSYGGANTGGGGQCQDMLRNDNIKIKNNWNQEMIDKLYQIWKDWHLNDCRPYCEHQKALGWRELRMKEVKLYHWNLGNDWLREQKTLKDEIMDTIKQGKNFKPTKEQTKLLCLQYSLTTHTDKLSDEFVGYYAPVKKESYNRGHIETKTLGWLYPMNATGAGTDNNKHPEGLLTKPCPECGYKYGSAWLTEEVPEDVLEWLKAL